MKIKCILYSKTHKEEERGSTWTYKYRPTLDDYQKKIILAVNATDPYSTLGELGLPDTIGDIIVLELATKEEQTKLAEDKKEKKE